MSEGIRLGEVEIKRESAAAILVEIDDEEVWIPKSVIHDDSEVYGREGDKGELIVKEWWAKSRGYV